MSVLLLLTVASLGWAEAPRVEKEWSFLVFINADNNLDEYGVLDLEEMARVGSNDRVNIVTLIDRLQAPATMNYIEKGKITPISEPVELDMGDYRELVNFVGVAVERYPARNYCLIVWNHGAGWKQKGAALKGISYDDQSGNHITTEQLGIALREVNGLLGRPIDLFCMDACLMQMLEVAWEIRRSCRYLVASEETIPGDGFPYEQVLKALKPGIGPREFGAEIVREYKLCYSQDVSDGGVWDVTNRPRRERVVKKTTLSLLDCARLDDLKTAVDGFAETLMAVDQAQNVAAALKETHSFTYSTNVDLWHLVDLVMAKVPSSMVKNAGQKVKDEFKNVVLANGVTGDNDQTWPEPDTDDLRRGRFPIDAHGLAIYFPDKKASFAQNYLDLTYARESRWDEFLHDHYLKLAAREALDGLSRGTVDQLRQYVADARPADRETHRTLLRQANFTLFCEGLLSPAVRYQATGLLKQLAATMASAAEN
ncbi:MAG TPA: clostripain-related cysteine peptidase [Candidatus Ozemobacteraceae bacterium]|nr:clostripain-related cysteine peptidase [Candidatus Ozemobacteraceae bacterium]